MFLKSGVFCAVCMASFFQLATGPTLAAPLAAHRAIYDFELKDNQRSSGYSAAEGRLAYEITGSVCEGWSVNYRFASRYVQSEGTVQLTDTQLTSWEAGDGSEMRLNQKQYVDNALSSENKITVKRKAPLQVADGEITAPAAKSFKLSPETLFPILFQSALLDDATTGKSRNTSLVFEGTDGEKPFRVISIIGKRKIGDGLSEDAKLVDAAPLKAMSAWPITTSYYPAIDDQSDQPIYQSHYTMYENGVSTDLLFDYGAYSLKGTLKKLELFTSSPCQ
jgi:hypothetical protein